MVAKSLPLLVGTVTLVEKKPKVNDWFVEMDRERGYLQLSLHLTLFIRIEKEAEGWRIKWCLDPSTDKVSIRGKCVMTTAEVRDYFRERVQIPNPHPNKKPLFFALNGEVRKAVKSLLSK
ncbi:MAG TPA: hypothetical protein VD967_03135 [Candidatus Paceibacterota bacterium]|nr:hypothetical protein [Candidatus Paceibacterota bacterium]